MRLKGSFSVFVSIEFSVRYAQLFYINYLHKFFLESLSLLLVRVISSVFQWLGSIINMCNKKLGTPFERCQNVFEGAVADCKAKLGPYLGLVCNITYIVSTLCYIVKPLDFICMLVSYISDAVVGVVRNSK